MPCCLGYQHRSPRITNSETSFMVKYDINIYFMVDVRFGTSKMMPSFSQNYCQNKSHALYQIMTKFQSQHSLYSSYDMSRIVRKTDFCICGNFAIRIVQSLYYLNSKFQASNHLLSQYSLVCVGPGRKPRRPVFSQRGSYEVAF